MKILLAAINAKYIHSNLGIYSLKAYAQKRLNCRIEIGEYTINHQMDGILQDIYWRKPDIVGFSCYVWNIIYVKRLVRNLVKVLPDVIIWLGGPEVSYDAPQILWEERAVAGIMTGEGEATFAELAACYQQEEDRKTSQGADAGEVCGSLKDIAGIVFRSSSGQIITTARRELLSMDEIPFPYSCLEGMEHRIVYYESSRGCPYSCSYCLSSVDKTVRFRSLELVKRELDFFLEQKVPQVKFVDRTFNCKRSHSLAVWKYLLEHDNGVTNFHFEISADLMDSEQLNILRQMRPGLVQLEIGVQSANLRTIREIRRTMDLERLEKAVAFIKKAGNIHQHLDLIAGLPYEDYESFRLSFDRVYRMKPDQLQLGFLKVLKGSYMAEAGEDYGLCYHEEPPYEVLSTRWLDYEAILELKLVEEMVEVYHNSRQFTHTLQALDSQWDSPYAMFREIGNYYEARKLTGISHSRLARYEILYGFLKENYPGDIKKYGDLLTYDLYLRENVKSRPGFAGDQSPFKKAIRNFFAEESTNARYLKGYEGYSPGQVSKMAHLEVLSDGRMILFDYKERDPLNHNAKATEVGRWLLFAGHQ